jgi:tRNA (guanine-N7-)-methyltransferase
MMRVTGTDKDSYHRRPHRPQQTIAASDDKNGACAVVTESAARAVSSRQQHPHPRLFARLARHRSRLSLTPVSEHAQAAFATLQATYRAHGGPLVFDSFCGTGHSTAALAERLPAALVIGIDQSAARLARHPGGPSANYALLRSDCSQVWRLAVAAGLQLRAHFLLYPNPWPKPGHLRRRIHGDDGFYALVALGGQLDLRSNWQVYVEEFGMAILYAGGSGLVREYRPELPLTLFERKYQRSGHTLWQFHGELPTG